MPLSDIDKNYLTTHEAGAKLNYSRQYICQLVRSGELIGQRFGRDVLVTQSSVRAYQHKYKGHRTRGPKPVKLTLPVSDTLPSAVRRLG